MSEAISRAELEEYDHDELVDFVLDLSHELEEVDGKVNRLIDASGEDRVDLRRMLNKQADAIEELEKNQQRMQSRIDDSGGKDSKVGQIVRFANNARENGQRAVKLNAKDIKGATGCSRRYAYDLMDDLPEEYDWFLTPEEMTQYGSLQIDNTDERRLGIDFEGVHSTGCPLNKFTTTPEGEEGE